LNSPEKETMDMQITKAFKLAIEGLNKKEDTTDMVWWKHKNPTIYHLMSGAVMPFARTGIKIGGWSNTLNAVTDTHGPSWRMIVHLTSPTEAYGIYPGGQSGNPGSKYYDDYVNNWASGKYYPLWLMKENEKGDDRIKWILTFSRS
jgi:penicillin amidase